MILHDICIILCRVKVVNLKEFVSTKWFMILFEKINKILSIKVNLISVNLFLICADI